MGLLAMGTVRPHDTDRILETLGGAIEKLRQPYFNQYDGEEAGAVANDLALLHGAVSAEAQSYDDELERRTSLSLLKAGVPKPIDVKPSLAYRQRYLRLLKRETIKESDRRGEHRD